jgi:ubiquinone/menaquinone biosynthesis C-methylase UbiE
MAMNETYTPGYSSNVIEFMSRRSVERQASFLLPHLKSNQRLLDIGCGPATITLGLAQIVSPGEVVGIDMAESQLNLARQNANQNQVQNIQFVSGSIYQLPFGDDEFDVVFSHAVFEHLKAPVAALREIYRVLKPGGLVALRSPDWDGFIIHPFSTELKAAMEYYKTIQTTNGGDVLAGRKLKDWVQQAGFHEAKWSGSFEFTDDIVAISEYLASQLELNAGKCSLDKRTLNQFANAFRQLPSDSAAIFAGSWGEVIARK